MSASITENFFHVHKPHHHARQPRLRVRARRTSRRCGEAPYVPAPVRGRIHGAIKFLKDNGIDCAGSANPDVQDLVANLPTFEDVSKDEVNLLN